MGSFLETIYDVLFKPKAAMEYIAEKKLTGQAFVMFTIGMLVPVWAVYTGIKGAPAMPVVGGMFALHFFGSLMFWILGAAVLNFVAELAGGRGTAVGLFAAMGFSHLPRVVVIPLGVIAALLPEGLRGLAFGAIGLLVVIWTMALNVAAIRGAHGLSTPMALLVLFTPILALFGAIIAAIVFVGSAIPQIPFNL